MLNIILGIILTVIVGLITLSMMRSRNLVFNVKHISLTAILCVVTFGATLGLGKVFLFAPYEKMIIQKEANLVPIMSAIKQYHPKEYAELMDEVQRAAKKDGNHERVFEYAYIIANRLFLKDLKSAPDEVIYHYIYNMKQFYSALYAIKPSLIVKMERADISLRAELMNLLKDPELKKIFSSGVLAKSAVIKAAVQTPSAAPTQNIVVPIFSSLMKKLYFKYGEEAVNGTFNLSNTKVDPDTEGKIIMDFYQEIISLDRVKLGELMRYIAYVSDKNT
jgi:hypothetical protein